MIYELAYKLNEELLKDEIILMVKENEKIMNNNEEFIKLIMYYESLKTEINDLEKYGLDVNNKQSELYNLRLKIDNLKVVKNYKDSYLIAKEYLKNIANETFKDIDEDLKINSIF